MPHTSRVSNEAEQRAYPFEWLRAETLAAIKLQIDNGRFTKRGLARLAKISQPHLCNVLSGKRKANIEMLDRICHAARIDRTGRILH